MLTVGYTHAMLRLAWQGFPSLGASQLDVALARFGYMMARLG